MECNFDIHFSSHWSYVQYCVYGTEYVSCQHNKAYNSSVFIKKNYILTICHFYKPVNIVTHVNPSARIIEIKGRIPSEAA
jgi:hypothetical protein